MTDQEQPGNEPIKRLGDFELLREIGRGGMGVVYEARQLSLDRRVALKVLPPAIGMSPQSIQRFEREARAAAKLHHTNIVPVHGIGQQDGYHFYAMELIEGPSLDQLLAEQAEKKTGGSRPPERIGALDATRTSVGATGAESAPSLTPAHHSFEGSLTESSGDSRKWFDTVARLIAAVAEGLAYAHRRGIIHRDIKPGNLMLSPEGHLCLTDFGLARMAEETGMTVSGSFLGTPAYMSPEQIAAGRIQLDHRTDIYSLGAVLYEMLTLSRPFGGRSRDEVLTSIMTREPVAPRRLNPRIPVDLETICLKAMEKDPARRYATAEAFAADLHQFLAHELIAARRAGPLRRAAKAVRRHPVVAVATVAAVLLLVVGGFAWQASKRADLDRLLGEAQLALSRGENRVALARADRVLARDPDFAGARLARARALLGILGRQQEAIAEGEALIAADPDDWKGHAILVAAAQAGFYGKPLEPHVEAVERLAPETAEAYTLRALITDSSLEAIALLDRALRIDPGHAEALQARAFRHIDRKSFRAAIEDADRLLAARPRSSMGRFLRTICFMELHDAAAAREEIEEAIRLAPVAENYAIRGLIRSTVQDMAGAWDDIVAAAELEPDNPNWLDGKAYMAMQAGRLDEALEAVRASLALDPSNPNGHAMLAGIHRARGELEEIPPILDELDRMARETTDPESLASIRRTRASMLEQQGDLDEAIAEAEAAVDAEPDSWANYFLRARLRQRRDGFEAMAEDCRLAASVPEEEPNALFLRAIRLNSSCKMEELALADLGRLRELTPGWPDVPEARGWIHLTAKRYEEALADFETVVEIAPEWDFVWYRLGSTLYYLDRHEEAVEAFARARELGITREHADSLWAHALIALRRDEEALRVADARIERLPDRGSSYVFKGRILGRIGRVSEAVESITKGIELEPERDWSAYVYRAGWSLVGGLRTCEDNLADLDKALAMDPDARGGVAGVAGMWLSERCPKLYDARRFETLAREANAYDPKNASYRAALGVVLFNEGRYQEARTELEKALETHSFTDPHAPDTLQYLAMTEWRLGNRARARDYRERAADLIDRLTPNDASLVQTQERVDELLGALHR